MQQICTSRRSLGTLLTIDALKGCSAITRPTIWSQEERPYAFSFGEKEIQIIRDPRAKKHDAYVVGFIGYDDIFDNAHRTYFCYKYLLKDGLPWMQSCDNAFAADY